MEWPHAAIPYSELPLQFSSPALFVTRRKDTHWIKLKARDRWEQTLPKGEQLLGIEEQAEHFSFCKQLVWELFLWRGGCHSTSSTLLKLQLQPGNWQVSVKGKGHQSLPAQSRE